jgi:hypothetical protein
MVGRLDLAHEKYCNGACQPKEIQLGNVANNAAVFQLNDNFPFFTAPSRCVTVTTVHLVKASGVTTCIAVPSAGTILLVGSSITGPRHMIAFDRRLFMVDGCLALALLLPHPASCTLYDHCAESSGNMFGIATHNREFETLCASHFSDSWAYPLSLPSSFL